MTDATDAKRLVANYPSCHTLHIMSIQLPIMSIQLPIMQIKLPVTHINMTTAET